MRIDYKTFAIALSMTLLASLSLAAADAPADDLAARYPSAQVLVAAKTQPGAQTQTAQGPSSKPKAQKPAAQSPKSDAAASEGSPQAVAQKPQSRKQPAAAQEKSGRLEMDLLDCVRSALERHPALQAAAWDVKATRAKVDQAVAMRRPKLNSEWGYVRTEKDPYFDIQGMGTIVFGEKSNYYGKVELEVPIYTGGALEAMAERARHETRASSENLQRQRQIIAAEAARAYYRALTARRLIGVMEAQVRALQEALRVARAMYDQGIVAKLDVLRPEVALSAAKDMLRKTQNGYQVALQALRHAVGLPVNAEVEPREAEVQLPVPEDIYKARTLAWANRPEIRQLEAYRQAALAGARAARAQDLPQIGVRLTWDAQRTTLMPMYGDWIVGVVIKQKIFDGKLADSQVKEALAQADKLQAKLAELRSGIAVEVSNAILNVQSARDRVETTAKAVAAAEEAYRLALLGYRNQVTPMLDVLQAQAALTKARADHEIALYDLNVAIVDAYLAMGRLPLPPKAK